MNLPGELVLLADGSFGTCDYEMSDEACGGCGHSWICHYEHDGMDETAGRFAEGVCAVGPALTESDPQCSCTRFSHTGHAEGDEPASAALAKVRP